MKNKLTGKDFLLLLLYLPGKTGEFNEPIEGITRLTKSIFLFEKEIKKNLDEIDSSDIYSDFEAWNFGPWSKQVSDDLGFFQNIKFIESFDVVNDNMYPEEFKNYEKFETFDVGGAQTEEPGPEEKNKELELNKLKLEKINIPSYEQKGFKLSNIGFDYVVENIVEKFSEKQQDLISRFKKRINTLSLYALLKYVYKNYDDYTKRSEIKDKILK